MSHQLKDEVQENALLKGQLIWTPVATRNNNLPKIHDGDQDIIKCNHRARKTVRWLGSNQQVKEMITCCELCIKYQQVRYQSLHPATLPEGPWWEVGSDLLKFKEQTYMLLVECYTLGIAVLEVKEKISKSVIFKLKNAFAQFGIPLKLMSGNRGSYRSGTFKRASDQLKFKPTMSSPIYPGSNGLAGRSVQIVKRLWKKSEDFYQSVVIYSGHAPAELMLGRQIRTWLPHSASTGKEHFYKNDRHLKDRRDIPTEELRLKYCQSNKW